MADYIYLLENRLSAGQQTALRAVRDIARDHGLTVFLVGGAVRDLTSGSPVRDLDVVVQGNALKLKKEIELAHGVITGESAAGQALFVRFAGGVRMEIGSTLSITYSKPGKPVAKPATILDDLRRRDFTANAMALSLNDGSYGLLMDPLNGVADIENRELRLVSNYGFIEDPVRMIRAARFAARLGWAMEEKTQARYETGKQEDYIAALGSFPRGYETEEIFHEEDPLRILRKLEDEGWMRHLFPALTVAKANSTELEKLRDVQTQIQMRGIQPEAASANFPLLTAKLAPKEIADLKHSFVRSGFVKEIESLESEAKEFATLLSGKGAATPSQAWKLLVGAKPEAVLWVAYSSKSATIQAKLKSFFTEWPQARTKIPYTLMQEMRIVPELVGFDDLVETLFFELMDGRLGTVEEMKAFLESYSPPAPPPPVHLRRPRAAKKDAKGAKSRKKVVAVSDDGDDEDAEDADAAATAPAADEDDGGSAGGKADETTKQDAPVIAEKVAPLKAVLTPQENVIKAAPAKKAPAKGVAAPEKAAPAKPEPVRTPPVKAAGRQVVAAKVEKRAAAPAKKAAAPAKKVAAPAKKAVVKAPVKVATKSGSAKAAVKSTPAKKAVPVKQAAKKTATPVKIAAKTSAKAPAKAAPAKKVAAKKTQPVKQAVKVAAKKKGR